MKRKKTGITKAFRESMAAIEATLGLETAGLLFRLTYSHEDDGLCISYDIAYNGPCSDIPEEFNDEPVYFKGCIDPDGESGRPACFVFVLDPGDLEL